MKKQLLSVASMLLLLSNFNGKFSARDCGVVNKKVIKTNIIPTEDDEDEDMLFGVKLIIEHILENDTSISIEDDGIYQGYRLSTPNSPTYFSSERYEWKISGYDDLSKRTSEILVDVVIKAINFIERENELDLRGSNNSLSLSENGWATVRKWEKKGILKSKIESFIKPYVPYFTKEFKEILQGFKK